MIKYINNFSITMLAQVETSSLKITYISNISSVHKHNTSQHSVNRFTVHLYLSPALV